MFDHWAILERRAAYGGRKGRSARRRLRRLERGRCPHCGATLSSGYGLCGGGIGLYETCPRDLRHYFYKHQDQHEEADHEAG